MIGFLYRKAQYFLRLHKHRVEWRKANAHNRTIASTFFHKEKVKVGKYTYGDLHIISYGEDNSGLEIGNYVSIADRVKFLLGGNHYYKRFTNFPFKAIFIDYKIIETWTKGKTIIEDDVWIGTEAFIMPGVRVGKGAIVGARAVVSKDVPPYAVVAGNPARVVKYRFSEELINKIKDIDFSTLPPELMLNNESIYKKEEDFDDLISLIKSHDQKK